jgi:hypothetical protein
MEALLRGETPMPPGPGRGAVGCYHLTDTTQLSIDQVNKVGRNISTVNIQLQYYPRPTFMAPFPLSSARYGKEKVRVFRVARSDAWHEVVEYTVSVLLEGSVCPSNKLIVQVFFSSLARS